MTGQQERPKENWQFSTNLDRVIAIKIEMQTAYQEQPVKPKNQAVAE